MRSRIEVNPQVHFGKPCIAGTRIPVQDVLELVKEGVPFKEIVRDYYPDIQVADVRACVEYAMQVMTIEDLRFSAAPA